jgi:hypothetical protein
MMLDGHRFVHSQLAVHNAHDVLLLMLNPRFLLMLRD